MGDFLLILLHIVEFPAVRYSEARKEEIQGEMVDSWIQFIWSGNPGSKKFFSTWQSFQREHEYLNISGVNSLMATNDQLNERMMLWEEIMADYN